MEGAGFLTLGRFLTNHGPEDFWKLAPLERLSIRQMGIEKLVIGPSPGRLSCFPLAARLKHIYHCVFVAPAKLAVLLYVLIKSTRKRSIVHEKLTRCAQRYLIPRGVLGSL